MLLLYEHRKNRISFAAVKIEYFKFQDFPILTNEREWDYNEINP